MCRSMLVLVAHLHTLDGKLVQPSQEQKFVGTLFCKHLPQTPKSLGWNYNNDNSGYYIQPAMLKASTGTLLGPTDSILY
jgi:hypothetical protein